MFLLEFRHDTAWQQRVRTYCRSTAEELKACKKLGAGLFAVTKLRRFFARLVAPVVTTTSVIVCFNKLCAWRHNMPRPSPAPSRAAEQTQRSSTFPRRIRSHADCCSRLTR